jgi:hypothetical protein
MEHCRQESCDLSGSLNNCSTLIMLELVITMPAFHVIIMIIVGFENGIALDMKRLA